MNRIVTTIAVALATIVTANAQEFKVGVKAGALFSTLSDPKVSIVDDDSSFNGKVKSGFTTGFHFGTFVEYAFNDCLIVEGGLDYAFQGAKLKSIEGTSVDGGNVSTQKFDLNSKARLKTQQLNVPLWVKYDIAGFRPKVGINLGLLSKAEVKDVDVEENVRESFSLTADKKFDVALGVGAEYNLPFGLFFDATFNLGLTNLSTKAKADENGEIDVMPMEFKNRVIQVGVGYKF